EARRTALPVNEPEPDARGLGDELGAEGRGPRRRRIDAEAKKEAPPVDELEPGSDATSLRILLTLRRTPVGPAVAPPGGRRSVQAGALERSDCVEVGSPAEVGRSAAAIEAVRERRGTNEL